MEDVIRLRRVEESDCGLIYQWANDPETRKNSLNKAQILYEDHCRWFEGKLQDGDCDFFVCELKTKAVGQIRLDYLKGSAVISYSVAKDFRGQGLGSQMLKLVEEQVKENILYLYGIVKKENIASQRAFAKNGYERQEVVEGYRYCKAIM